MKEKKLFSSIEGIDSKFVNEALETMSKNIDCEGEDAEIFSHALDSEKVEMKKSYKPLLFRGISLAAGMCAVWAAVIALNNFGRKIDLSAQTGGADDTVFSDSEDISDSGLTDTAISEETAAGEKEIIINTPVSGLPEVTSPVYAAAEEYVTLEKTNLSECFLERYYLVTDEKIYVGETKVTGKEITLTCFDIATGKSEILLKETSEEILYNLKYYPICEYNGYLYLQRSDVDDDTMFSMLRINLSDKNIETVIEDIYYEGFPHTLKYGNMLYIEKKGEGENSYYIDIYDMDTGEINTFKEQARHPQVYKGGIAYLTNGAMYMCDAVTGENEKKICDIDYSIDKWYYGDDTIYSDGETLFRFVMKETQEDDPVFFGNEYCIFEEFDGEEFKPKAIFVGYIPTHNFQCADGLIAFEAGLVDHHRSEGIIYDKNSGEFIRLSKEDKAIEFYSSENRLFYNEGNYNAKTNIVTFSGDRHYEVIRK